MTDSSSTLPKLQLKTTLTLPDKTEVHLTTSTTITPSPEIRPALVSVLTGHIALLQAELDAITKRRTKGDTNG